MGVHRGDEVALQQWGDKMIAIRGQVRARKPVPGRVGG